MLFFAAHFNLLKQNNWPPKMFPISISKNYLILDWPDLVWWCLALGKADAPSESTNATVAADTKRSKQCILGWGAEVRLGPRFEQNWPGTKSSLRKRQVQVYYIRRWRKTPAAPPHISLSPCCECVKMVSSLSNQAKELSSVRARTKILFTEKKRERAS